MRYFRINYIEKGVGLRIKYVTEEEIYDYIIYEVDSVEELSQVAFERLKYPGRRVIQEALDASNN